MEPRTRPCRELGRLDEAEALCRRLVEAKEEALGPKHPDTLKEMDTLANVLGRQGKLDEVEALYRRALEGYEEASDELHHEHMHTHREAMRNLANLLEIRGEAAAAEELRAQILARWGVEGVDYEE